MSVAFPSEESLGHLIHSLDDLQQALDALTPQLEHDQALELLNAAVALRDRACDLHSRCLALALVWVQHNGPLTCGEVRWEARNTKKVTCRNLLATAEGLLDQLGGDVAGLVGHLQAQPFKHGSCRHTLGTTAYERLFEVRFDDRIQLVRLDTRWVRAGRGPAEELDHG